MIAAGHGDPDPQTAGDPREGRERPGEWKSVDKNADKVLCYQMNGQGELRRTVESGDCARRACEDQKAVVLDHQEGAAGARVSRTIPALNDNVMCTCTVVKVQLIRTTTTNPRLVRILQGWRQNRMKHTSRKEKELWARGILSPQSTGIKSDSSKECRR